MFRSPQYRGRVDQLLHHLLSVSPVVVLLVVGALVFAEAAIFIGFVLPGETAVLVGGFVASTGRLSVVVLGFVVVAAAIVGDSVGYQVGKYLGPRLLAWHRMERHLSRVEAARAFLDGRGAPAVFVGRFTAFLRAVIPGLAGLSRMRYRRFLLYNALGGLVWGVGCVVAGYVAGSSYLQVARWLGRGGAVAVAVVVVVAVAVWLHRRRGRADDRSIPMDRAA